MHHAQEGIGTGRGGAEVNVYADILKFLKGSSGDDMVLFYLLEIIIEFVIHTLRLEVNSKMMYKRGLYN